MHRWPCSQKWSRWDNNQSSSSYQLAQSISCCCYILLKSQIVRYNTEADVLVWGCPLHYSNTIWNIKFQQPLVVLSQFSPFMLSFISSIEFTSVLLFFILKYLPFCNYFSFQFHYLLHQAKIVIYLGKNDLTDIIAGVFQQNCRVESWLYFAPMKNSFQLLGSKNRFERGKMLLYFLIYKIMSVWTEK